MNSPPMRIDGRLMYLIKRKIYFTQHDKYENKKMNVNMMKFMLIVLAAVLNVLTPVSAHAEKSPYDWAFIQLDYIRQEKVDQLDRFTKIMKKSFPSLI